MRTPEEGFTLIEVLVAILIIGTMLLVLLGVSSGALAVQETARRQQVAAGIANEVMERLRSLSFDEIRDGVGEGALTYDTSHAIQCGADRRLLPDADCLPKDGLGEIIMSVPAAAPTDPCPPARPMASTMPSPLLPANCSLYSLNGVEYRAYAYVTSRTAKTVSAKDAPYRLTVIVEWSDRGQSRRTVLQAMAWTPDGCTVNQVGLIAGSCGKERKTSFGFSRDSAITVAFCSNPPTCNSSSDPSIEIHLGYLSLTREESAGDVQLYASFSPSSVITSDGTTKTTVVLSRLGTTDIIEADNIDSPVGQTDAIQESAGPLETGRGTSASVKTKSYKCTLCDPFGSNWDLQAVLYAPGACLTGAIACAELSANAGENGECELSGTAVSAARCVAGQMRFAAAVEISLCQRPSNYCFVIARIVGGSIEGALTGSSNSLGVLGSSIQLGYLGPPFKSNAWAAQVDYGAIANSWLSQSSPKLSEYAEPYGYAPGGYCVAAPSYAPSLLPSSTTPQSCFFRPDASGNLDGNAPRSEILQLYGLNVAKAGGGLSGATWLYGAFNGVGTVCDDNLKTGKVIYDVTKTAGGGVYGSQGGCPLLAPPLKVSLWLPKLSASDSAKPTTGKWYGW